MVGSLFVVHIISWWRSTKGLSLVAWTQAGINIFGPIYGRYRFLRKSRSSYGRHVMKDYLPNPTFDVEESWSVPHSLDAPIRRKLLYMPYGLARIIDQSGISVTLWVVGFILKLTRSGNCYRMF